MFFVLFILFFLVGLLSLTNPRIFLILGTVLAVSLPFSNHYASLHYFNGVMVLDGFFLGLIPLVMRIFLTTKAYLPSHLVRLFLIFFTVFLGYFVVATTYLQRDLIDLLKEFRPIIHLTELLMLLLIARNTRFEIDQKLINRIAIYAAVSNIIYFIFGFFGYSSFEDVFYQNNANRYLDLSTYFSVYFILHNQYEQVYKKSSQKTSKWALLISIVSILLTNSRVLILATIVGVGILRSRNMKNRIKYIFWSGVILLVFVQFSVYIGQERVLESLNQDGFMTQLLVRYSPAVVPLIEMNTVHYFFGYGIGYYFEIPWFGYREISPFNISLDSAYLTQFIKQGCVGLLFLFASLRFLAYTNIRKLSTSIIAFWLIQFIVEASLFQNVVFGASFFLLLIHKKKYSYVE